MIVVYYEFHSIVTGFIKMVLILYFIWDFLQGLKNKSTVQVQIGWPFLFYFLSI